MSNLSLISVSRFGNTIKELLKGENFLDINRRTQRLDDSNVGIPLKTNNVTNLEELHMKIANILKKDSSLSDITWEIKEMKLPLSKKKVVESKRGSLIEKLQDVVCRCGGEWTAELEGDVPRSWEKHGDMVLVPHTCFKSAEWTKYAPECWEVVVNHIGGKRLAVKQTITSDGYRTPQVTLLLGESGWVEHVDNGIRYTYDITQCMFSAGNITEKLRVAGFDCRGETVLDLYAGIGYFTLPYLVHAKAEFVHACEWNPHSMEALQRNLQLNKVSDRCQIHAGDNRKFQMTDFADRVNLGLIPTSEEGWLIACRALRTSSGGILHIHGNVESRQTERIHKTHSEGGEDSENDCSSQTNSHRDEKSNSDDLGTPSVLNFEASKSLPSERTEKDGLAVLDSDASYLGNKGKDCTDHDGVFNCIHTDSLMKAKWKSWAVQTASKIRDLLKEIHALSEWRMRVLHIEHVKSYAPHVDHLVLDLECRPINR